LKKGSDKIQVREVVIMLDGIESMEKNVVQ